MSSGLPFQVGSPAGMGQLIKYFESQSKRLDKQALVPHVSSLNSDFESMIKFNGVPILPPAMTSGRREELLQLKKSAILLEKRQKARQRRQLMPKTDSISAERKLTFPETSPRPAARQLNFDSDVEKGENMPERVGAMNPVSAFATAETAMPGEDFGLQTMDSVNSDFMSMEQSSIPKVFAGLALTSFKEQKISYDLDRLSKVLNVQDMASTSGSDVSDALGNTQTLGEEDLKDAQRLAQKFLHKNPDGRSNQTTGFFHESQDTVVEVSPEPGTREDLSTSGFVDNTASSNLEHTQTSLGSSPGCGSANTTATTDSQRSNRSSPKSLKNAVHFASFLTEYNTSSSQLFERPTIVKKKMPYEQSVPDLSSEAVVPIIGDPAEARQRLANKSAEGDSRSNPLLNRVALNPDSDSSPVTPPFDPTSGVPFQSYGKSEPYSSDKENDASQSHSTSPTGYKKSPDRPGRPSPKDQASPDTSQRWASQRRAQEKRYPTAVSPETLVGGYKSDETSRRSPHYPIESERQPHSLQFTGATSGVGPQHLSSNINEVGASPASVPVTSKAGVALSLVTLSSGVVSVGQTSVSDSQGSNRSGTLTGGTSESSSSTIKDDLSARDSGNLAMNIVVAGHGSVNLDTAPQETSCSRSTSGHDENTDAAALQNRNSSKSTSEASFSPKKLNTDYCTDPPQTESYILEQEETPPRQFVRKGSYTLSEPSPALLKARARYHEEASKQSIPISDDDPQRPKSDLHGGESALNDMKSATVVHEASDSNQVQRKHPTAHNDQSISQQDSSKANTSRLSKSPEAEREGKAEHINKYLSQVQFQNSMNLSCQSWDGANQSTSSRRQTVDHDQPNKLCRKVAGDESMAQAMELLENEDSITGHSSMLDVLKSLAESVQGSRDAGSVTELLSLHHQQMECERQALIQQQQRDMEELFVQQRRDMLLLEAEIKAAQQLEKEQQEFLIENLPENIKVKARNYDGEYSPEHTGTFTHNRGSDNSFVPGISQDPHADPIHSLDNRRPQSQHHRSGVSGNSNSVELNLQLQPKSFPGANSAKPVQKAKKVSPYPLLKKSKVLPYSPRSAWDESQTQVKTVGDGSFSPRDGSTSLGLPGYSPSTSSPRFHRSHISRSPLKYSSFHRRDVRVIVPPEAHTPDMQAKFEKLSAVAKGFLTRCLLQSDKVQELIKTIKDTREFAFKFQTETPVKKGVFTPQDRALLERIVAQLQAALLDIHEIFFEIPCSERMAMIEQTRNKEYDKRVKMSKDSIRGSGPRISQATLKALERKRKAKEAEASIAHMVRPRTAPSSSNSPRCQNHTDVRALKPLQGQSHHHSVGSAETRQDPSRQGSDKERPRTAPVKQLTKPKRITALSSRQMNPPPSTSSGESNRESPKEGLSKPSSTAATKVVIKTKGASVKPVSNRPGKSWR